MAETLRVLVVEGDSAAREVVASSFETEPDFEVVGLAGSLSQARQMLDDVDVAIVDLELPDGSGADLVPELLAANPEAHVLVLTSSDDRAMAAKATEDGARAVFDKATALADAAQMTRRLLRGRRRPAANAGPASLRLVEPISPSGDGGLQLAVTKAEMSTTVTLEGEWDLATRDVAYRTIARELACRPRRLVLDLSRLSFIDGRGVHSVIDLGRSATRMKVDLRIVPGPRAVQRVFELCGSIEDHRFAAPPVLDQEPREATP